MSWCISTSSPSAQANRLFFRTKGGWLYCVGDPGDPFPSPKDCPVAGRAGPWQHSKPPLMQLQQVLRILGSAADATIVAELKDGSKESREAIATELVRGAWASRANDPAVSAIEKETAAKKGKR